MGLLAWLQQKKEDRIANKLVRKYFLYWWEQYKDIDGTERDALMNYQTAKRICEETGNRGRHISDAQANLFWEQGYRHGDHVLLYNPYDGSFKEMVITKFHNHPVYYDEPSFMPPDMIANYEEAQGTTVKSEDRTQRKSQPDFASHTTGWLLTNKMPHPFP